MRSQHHSQTGQTLLEVVVSIGIVVGILVALMSGVVSSLRNVRYSKDTSLATQYAQGGLEATRSIRDRSYSLIATNGTYGLQWDGSQWILSATPESIGTFTRTVTIDDGPSPDAKSITVTLSWQEGNSTETVEISTILVNIN